MRFKKTRLGKDKLMEYPLTIYGEDDKPLLRVTLAKGAPKLAVTELKSIIDKAIAENKLYKQE